MCAILADMIPYSVVYKEDREKHILTYNIVWIYDLSAYISLSSNSSSKHPQKNINNKDGR